MVSENTSGAASSQLLDVHLSRTWSIAPSSSSFIATIFQSSITLLLASCPFSFLSNVEQKAGHGESWQALLARRGEHVTTGLNTSVVLDTAWGPLSPSAVCLDKGPPTLLSTGPQALTAEIQAGVIIWTGETRTCGALQFPTANSPIFMLTNSPAQQCESPVLPP